MNANSKSDSAGSDAAELQDQVTSSPAREIIGRHVQLVVAGTKHAQRPRDEDNGSLQGGGSLIVTAIQNNFPGELRTCGREDLSGRGVGYLPSEIQVWIQSRAIARVQS